MPRFLPAIRWPMSAVGLQPSQSPLLHHDRPLGQAARHREDQRHRHVGGVLGEDARRVRHHDAALERGRHVDMVEARAVVRDQPQARAGLGEEPRVDAVGDRRDEHVGLGHRAGERLGRQRLVVGVERDVEELLHPGLDRCGQAPGHDDARAG